MGNTDCYSWFYSKTENVCFGCNILEYTSTSLLEAHAGTAYYHTTVAEIPDIADDTASDVLVPECQEGWVYLHQSCYSFSVDEMELVEAWTNCLSLNSHLVFVETDDENTALKNYIETYSSSRYYWLPAKDNHQEGWSWYRYSHFFNTSDEIVVDGWSAGEPSNTADKNCVMLTTNGWYKMECDADAYPLCEKDMP